MFQKQLVGLPSSCWESLKGVEADVQHANTLASAIQRAYGGACIQMRLSYSQFAPILLFLIRWIECTCIDNLPSYLGLLEVLVYKVYVDGKTTISTYERRASVREFYGVIFPSLQQLESNLTSTDGSNARNQFTDMYGRMSTKAWWKFPKKDQEREDECGICLETCTKMVLPNCNHAMCIDCYHDWNTRSQSCPFCRGSLKRVASRDLWVLTDDCDIVDTVTLVKENLKRFHLYINNLPLAIPDSLFMVYYDYLV